MRTTIDRIVVFILLSLLYISPSWAIPSLSFDLDILTPGVQGSRDVQIGENFSIAVLLSDYDNSTLFDTVSFDLNYNDAAVVLAGVGGPAAGALVDFSPIETWDSFSFPFTDINQGDLLSTLDFGSVSGFQSNFGTFSYSSVTDPFALSGSTPFTVATYEFSATELGSSTLLMAADPSMLSYQGNPINILSSTGIVNVVNSVPEPAIPLLFFTGLIGLWIVRRTQKQV